MDELVEERRIGTSDAGKDANAACLALSKAARALLLYDADNQLIRDFLVELRDRMWAFGEMHGALDLDVLPFELQRDAEQVYLERDRERSLAWRMFRDGVRRLVIRPDVNWEELLSLLEILSIRYTGIRQQEDDIVTLLWRAGFENIEVHSVEGVISQDEKTTVQAGQVGRWTGPRYSAPDNWDKPLPDFEDRAEVAYREVDLDELDAVRLDQSTSNLVPLGMRLAEDLLRAALEEGDPISLLDVVPYLQDFRDHLVEEGRLPQLARLLQLGESLFLPVPPPIYALRAELGNSAALLRMIETQSHHVTPPSVLDELVRGLPEAPFEALIDVLGVTEEDSVRRLTRQLLEPMVPGREDAFGELTRIAPPRVASDLIRVASRAAPPLALQLSADLAVAGDDPTLVLEILHQVQNSESSQAVTEALVGLLECRIPEVRMRAIDDLAARVERSAYDSLVAVAETHAADGISNEEADKIGVAMATLLPEVASEQFEEWVQPDANVLQRLVSRRARATLRRVAVSGFAIMPRDSRGSRLLHWLENNSSGELQDHTREAIRTRREKLHGG